MILRTLAALVLACALPAAAGPQEAPGSANAEQIETRFNPPSATVQRFRVQVTKRGKTHSWVEELRFERNGEGYLAHWRMDPASFSAEMRHPLLAPTFRPFTGAPVILELDQEGNPLRIRDWEPLKARMLKSVETLAPLMVAGAANRGKADGTITRKVIDGATAMYAQLSAEAAPDQVVKYLVHVLGWGGHAMTVGETTEGVEQAEVPLFGTSVERRIGFTLAEAQPDTIRFVITGQIDGAALKGLMTKLSTMFENPDPAIRERARRSIAQLEQVTLLQTTTVLLDRATGLPRQLSQTVAADGKTADTLLIEWLNMSKVS